MKQIRIAFLLLFLPVCATAGEGGYSNYVPGFYGDLALAVEPPKGLSIRNDLYSYSADGSTSVRSGQVQADIELDLLFNYLTILYNPGIDVFGAHMAFSATATAGNLDINAKVKAGPLTLKVEDEYTGMGDLTLGTYFYWNRDKYHLAWANYLVMPTGSYDANNLANTGLNYWTIETDFMATYLDMDKGRDYSIVVGYAYNTENDDTDYKTGDEVHIDIVLNQFLSESFGVGINAFFFRQLSGDSGKGAVLGSFKGEASGIGPIVYYIKKINGAEVYFSAKWLKEFDVENRLEGDHVYASFSLSF